ncbi:Imm1 family immunity protein [Polymorphospora rubra]
MDRVTAGAEIPIEQMRAAAREFLTTGDRPTCVTWQ